MITMLHHQLLMRQKKVLPPDGVPANAIDITDQTAFGWFFVDVVNSSNSYLGAYPAGGYQLRTLIGGSQSVIYLRSTTIAPGSPVHGLSTIWVEIESDTNSLVPSFLIQAQLRNLNNGSGPTVTVFSTSKRQLISYKVPAATGSYQWDIRIRKPPEDSVNPVNQRVWIRYIGLTA